MANNPPVEGKPPVEEGVVRAQLEILENVYGIQILNKNELISWILKESHTDHEVYGMTAALNTWLSIENPSGPIRIPEKVFKTIADMIQKKEEFLH
jgi:hypothetical protein